MTTKRLIAVAIASVLVACGSRERREHQAVQSLNAPGTYLSTVKSVPANDVWPPPPAAQRTRHGVIFRTVHAGNGETYQAPHDAVVLEMATYDLSGRIVDRGTTNLDPPGPVVDEIVSGGKLGEVRRAWLPPAIAKQPHWVICDYEIYYIGK